MSTHANGTVSKATDDLLALADDGVRHTQAVAEYLRVSNYAQPSQTVPKCFVDSYNEGCQKIAFGLNICLPLFYCVIRKTLE
jgi:hypothetical protein